MELLKKCFKLFQKKNASAFIRTEIKEISLDFQQKKLDLGTYKEKLLEIRDIEPCNRFVREPEKMRQEPTYSLLAYLGSFLTLRNS